MYFQLSKEEIKFLKKQLPTIRLNGYDIAKFQSIMESFDKPIKAIPSDEIISKDVYNKSIKHVTKDILVDKPMEYEDLENNSFLKPPKVEKTIKKDNSLKEQEQFIPTHQETMQYKQSLEPVIEDQSIQQEEPVIEETFESNEQSLEQEIHIQQEQPTPIHQVVDESSETSETPNLPDPSTMPQESAIEEQPPIQTEPDDSIFNNQPADIDSASIFSVVDNRTKKE